MKKQLMNFLKILQYSLSSSKLLTGLLILANILLGLLSTVQIWLIGQIAETFGVCFRTLERLSVCLPYILGLFTLLFAQKLFFTVIPYGRTMLYTRVKQKMTQALFAAVDRISPVWQEQNEQQSRFERAIDFINRNFELSFHSVLTLISSFTSMVSVLLILSRYSIVFPLVAIATSVPVVFIRLKQDKAMHTMYRQQYSSNQLCAYYLNSLTTKDSLIELKIFDAESLFLDRHQAIAKNNVQQRTHYFIRHALHGNLLESLLFLAGNMILVGYALFLLFKLPELYSIGMLSVVISGAMSAQEEVIGFAFNGKYIVEASIYGEDFWDLIHETTDSIKSEKLVSSLRTLELKDVSFHYPNSETNQLDSINITLHAGETIGVVGENGSGKSTLSKVLLGIYAPCAGEIRVDGADVSLSGFAFDRVSAVFQDFIRYKLTVRENIWFSVPERIDDSIQICHAAQEADADQFIEQLPLRYDTPIGDLLEHSVELSGGEWQKLAVARSFYAKGALLVLDEPNANMDVLTEATIYRQYYKHIRGSDHIGILISHRLGSTRFCDRILVMKDGKIVQDGSFNKLMEQDGLYKTMYEAQSRWYQGEDNQNTQ